MAASGEFNPYDDRSPGLRILFASHPAAFSFVVLVSLIGVFWICRELSTPQAVAIALAVGMVVNAHSYIVDCVLLLPLIAAGLASSGLALGLALFLMSPVSYWALLAAGIGAPLRLAIATLAAACVWPASMSEGWSRASSPRSSA